MFVDDSFSVLEFLQWLFKNAPCYLFAFNNPFDALEVIGTLKWAVVVADRFMHSMNGLEFLKKVKVHSPQPMFNH